MYGLLTWLVDMPFHMLFVNPVAYRVCRICACGIPCVSSLRRFSRGKGGARELVVAKLLPAGAAAISRRCARVCCVLCVLSLCERERARERARERVVVCVCVCVLLCTCVCVCVCVCLCVHAASGRDAGSTPILRNTPVLRFTFRV